MTEIEEFQKFHPRAVKLLRKKKNFLVVACDEPYYHAVYSLIRAWERAKGTWSDADEALYCRDGEQNVQPTEAGRTDPVNGASETDGQLFCECPPKTPYWMATGKCVNCGLPVRNIPDKSADTRPASAG